ncbi:N-acetylglutaminylglutamine synthetase [Marinicauda salina]|uniref:N-acetylglutaminylglutamine synthetase n=1 Tax=Marinicauda salina TaxID=2135793 RepID=A0A2U2BV86_9PROT|nr:N-acetylglutaminylglutamine synthetase [Marinicauda salina]PWE17928.1 N-acetylglutaminylglutamine synthetase [Marinicauda salina]
MKSSDQPRKALRHRLKRLRDEGLKDPIDDRDGGDAPRKNAWIDVGWGRLIFAQTFENADDLVEVLQNEESEKRDIAFYVRDPHVVLAAGPQEVFLDPSHTYRIDLATYRASRQRQTGYFVRRLCSEADAVAVNAIYAARGMVQVDPSFFWRQRDNRTLTFLVCEDEQTGEILGSVTGVDHERAFGDPQHGSSLWCLAVSPTAAHPGIGEALVRRLIELFKARGCSFMDLSVLHDNESAIALYEKLGFKRLPFFTLKRKNVINEPLFIGPPPEEQLNAYARIIVDEARRRGIGCQVIDAEGGFFKLTYGGRSIVCRESLSELTSAVAMSWCDDKAATRRLIENAGVAAPRQTSLTQGDAAPVEFLEACGTVVVKPARGEQGRGVVVGVETEDELREAIEAAFELDSQVIVEEFVEGEDLRVVVINNEVVAAALRKPPVVTGDGRRSLKELVESLSRRRAAATQGESVIPLDAETERCLTAAGWSWEDVPKKGERIRVRKTANLHTGGALHDVTDTLHPEIATSAVAVARAIDIPVVGVDFIVDAPDRPDHVFIEANERPGLANHEPQPTAERFIDLLFPLSAIRHDASEATA